MRFSKLVLGLVFVLLNSASVFSQTPAQTEIAKGDPSSDIKTQRIARVKADILQEIQALPSKNQISYYTYLGRDYWDYDKKEGNYWLTRAIEIALSPATDYKDEAEKLTSLWNILVWVPDAETTLANRLLTQIKLIKIDESDPDALERANSTYLALAEHFLNKGDHQTALAYGILSLKGKKPRIDWHSSEFFKLFKFKNESTANAYFAKIIESVKFNADKNLTEGLVNYFMFKGLSNYPKQDISDSQRKDILEQLVPYIENEQQEITLKKITKCGLPFHWGASFLDDYKRLLPERASIVEQTVAVCRKAENLSWKTPEFLKKPRNTSQDWLDLAKEIPDKKIQARYLQTAASRARDEKNYQLSNSILDGIEKDFRDPHWTYSKIETVSKWSIELFKNDQLPEINRILESSPSEYVPFIIVKSLFYMYAQKPYQKEFVLNLMNTARAGFNSIERYPANFDSSINPTQFANLTQYYVKYGFYEEALATHEESIKAYNRLLNNLPSQFKDKIIPRYTSFARFTNQTPPNDLEFIDRYFDRIYENLGKIESPRTRLYDRLEFLKKMLEKPQRSLSVF